MKSNNLISSIVLAVILLLSCSKDSEVISTFPFTLTESHADVTIINTPQETFFKITPEKIVTTNNYSLRYEVVTGGGRYLDKEGKTIPPQEDVVLASLSPTFFYKASKTGEEKVKVYVKDNSGKEESIDIVYDVQHNPFSVGLSAPFSEAKVKSNIPITLSVFNEGEDDTLTYERAFYIVQGSGTIKHQGTDELLELEKFAEMKQGTFSFDLSFNDVGETKIKVAVRDSNYQLIEKTLTFSILDVDVSFSATVDKNTVNNGTENKVFFSLSEDQGQGGTYQMKYIVNKGTIDVLNGDQKVNPGVFVDVAPGSFMWSTIPTEVGTVDVNFVLKNQNGIELTQNITYEVLDINVSFGATVDKNLVTTGTENKIFFSLLEDQGQGGTYQLKYVVNEGVVDVLDGNQKMNPGVFVNVVPGSFSWSTIPTAVGTVDIDFVLKNQNGVEFTQSVSYMTNANQLSIAANFTNQTPLYVDQNKEIAFSLDSQQGPNGNYKLKYVINQGEVNLLSNNNLMPENTYLDINLGSFSWFVHGISSGAVDITFFFKDEYGTEVSTNMNFNVFQHILSFDLVPSNTQTYPNEAINIQATIEETPVASPPYAITFDSNLEGVIVYNNNVYHVNDVFYLLGANFNFDFIPYTYGEFNISVTAENQEGASDSFPINLSVSKPTFTVQSGHEASYFGPKLYFQIPNAFEFVGPNQQIQVKFATDNPDLTFAIDNANNPIVEQGVFNDISVDGQNIGTYFIKPTVLFQPIDSPITVTFKNQYGSEKVVQFNLIYNP